MFRFHSMPVTTTSSFRVVFSRYYVNARPNFLFCFQIVEPLCKPLGLIIVFSQILLAGNIPVKFDWIVLAFLDS